MTTTEVPRAGADAQASDPPVPEPEVQLASYAAGFDAFYGATFGGVVAVAHSMTGDRHLGEEIAQEAFITAHRQWGKVRHLDRPDLWVRRVAINRCTSTWRRKRIERRVNGQVAARTPSAHDGDGDAALERDELWAAVRRLPPRQLAVVVLHYVDDLSTPEIGELLGLTPSTVQTHLTRARERLGQILASTDPDPHQGANP